MDCFESGSVNMDIEPDHEDVAKCVDEGCIEIDERGLSHAYCDAMME